MFYTLHTNSYIIYGVTVLQSWTNPPLKDCVKLLINNNTDKQESMGRINTLNPSLPIGLVLPMC